MLEDKLLEKSKEAFIMAIEIYNKPTIKYRVEGFSFFICNAWELMLKAYLMKRDGANSIITKIILQELSLWRIAYREFLQTNKHQCAEIY